MTHDPLCPMAWGCSSPEIVAHEYNNFGLPCPHCERECICNLIAEVRKDERLAARYDVARVIMESMEGKRELNPAFFDAIYAAAGGTVEQEQP